MSRYVERPAEPPSIPRPREQRHTHCRSKRACDGIELTADRVETGVCQPCARVLTAESIARNPKLKPGYDNARVFKRSRPKKQRNANANAIGIVAFGAAYVGKRERR